MVEGGCLSVLVTAVSAACKTAPGTYLLYVSGTYLFLSLFIGFCGGV